MQKTQFVSAEGMPLNTFLLSSIALEAKSPINQFKFLAYTPKALNSKAQRRVAHAGLLITHND